MRKRPSVTGNVINKKIDERRSVGAEMLDIERIEVPDTLEFST